MANKQLFKSSSGVAHTHTRNEAGGRAYKRSDKEALAQIAVTGCLNNTYYTSSGTQLDTVLEKTKGVSSEFIAKLAVYSRTEGHMKDMPALLCAVLSARGANDTLRKVFPVVITNGKMLRNFVQIIRSGVTGKNSLSAGPRKLIRNLFNSWSDEKLFKQDVGQDPSLSDIIKMAHPKPRDEARSALYGYLLNKDYSSEEVCSLVNQYEEYKKGIRSEGTGIPDVPFQKLTALNLSTDDWIGIARNAPWHMTRMNLNTFQRHGVFKNREIVDLISDRLRDKEAIEKSRVFPYQLMIAYQMTASEGIPHPIREAIQDAMEISLNNTPSLEGDVVLAVDISASMGAPVTGHRRGGTTQVTCCMVASLFASAIKRTTPSAKVGAFDTSIVWKDLNPRDSVMTNMKILSRLGGSGGTDCSIALKDLNKNGERADTVIYISDGQSWADYCGEGFWARSGTGMAEEWKRFKRRNPRAKLICIDLQPYMSRQAPNDKDVLSVGGFSDQVFSVVRDFIAYGDNPDLWVSKIEEIEI